MIIETIPFISVINRIGMKNIQDTLDILYECKSNRKFGIYFQPGFIKVFANNKYYVCMSFVKNELQNIEKYSKLRYTAKSHEFYDDISFSNQIERDLNLIGWDFVENIPYISWTK